MMKATMIAVALSLTVAIGSAVGNDGQVSNDVMAKMGLGNAQVMTDAEGMQVRGKWAVVSGTSFASAWTTNGYSESTNSYAAGTDKFNKTGAAGSSSSFAKSSTTTVKKAFGFPIGSKTTTSVGISGGSSKAFAF